jgi:uncharacterized protein
MGNATMEGETVSIQPFITTYTGGKFWPLDPKPADVRIDDIAHALALKCRWTGHCKTFYSVAEHSVRVALAARSIAARRDLNPADATLFGLLHDTTEAYLPDIARPIKARVRLVVAGGHSDFRDHEALLLSVILHGLGVPYSRIEFPGAWQVAGDADAALLSTEARDLCAGNTAGWSLPAEPLPETITPWTWQEAERRFLAMWAEVKP